MKDAKNTKKNSVTGTKTGTKIRKVLVDESVLAQIRRQQVLSNIEIAINQTHQLAPLLKQIVAAVEKYLPSTGGSTIVLWDEETESFIHDTTSSPKQESKRVRRAGGATRWIIDNQETLIVPDVSNGTFTANKMLKENSILAYAGIPLIVDQKCFGVLYALSKEKQDYQQKDILFLEALAVRVASAVKNVALLEEVKTANDALMAEKFALEQSQNNLAESLVQLENLSQEKSRFFAGMSHEIRTPLNAIIGFAELLKEEVYGTLSEKQMRAVGDIHNSGNHLLELVNDLLDLSKLEAGKLELEPSFIDIQALLRDSLNYVRYLASQKDLSLSIVLAPDFTRFKNPLKEMDLEAELSEPSGKAIVEPMIIEPQLIYADKLKLRQILLNLLSNAVKYTPNGGTISLGILDKPKHHCIFVQDSGIGISEEDQAVLFQEFSQLDTEMNHEYQGTGLGLVLSQRLAKLHGGTIVLESTQGVGSTFGFELPKDIL